MKMLETRREAVLLNAANDNRPPSAGRGVATANLAPYSMGVAIWMVLAWSVGLL